MNGYTHMVIGGLCGGLPVALSIAEKKLGFTIGEHYIYPFAGVFPAVIGALGPDIDTPKSRGGKKLRFFLKTAITISGIMLLLLSIYIGIGVNGEELFNILVPCAVFFGVSCCVSMFVAMSKHRRETHSGLMMLILLLPNVYIVRFTSATLFTSVLLSIWSGFCIGWLSHLIADSFNKKGVPWLYPFSKKYYRISNFITGTEGEHIFRTFCIILFVTVYIVLIISKYSVHI
ncbi:MAG: metal-dependent hydrolase [Treponema sp.]|jgi:inner membrane protein|nr:metal-dependent hydrolase [Treponema sp.]